MFMVLKSSRPIQEGRDLEARNIYAIPYIPLNNTVWFDFFVINGISTFGGYQMSKLRLQKNNNGTIYLEV